VHKLAGNTKPDESRSYWDLPLGILPHLIEQVILAHKQKDYVGVGKEEKE
jgi:hypothetical protein